MSIFESLENLNVSEECFDDIMGIVEEIINEVTNKKWAEAAQNSLYKRRNNVAGSYQAMQAAQELGGDAPSQKEAHIELAKREAQYGRDVGRYNHAGIVAKAVKRTNDRAVETAQAVEKHNQEHSLDDKNPYKYGSRFYNRTGKKYK